VTPEPVQRYLSHAMPDGAPLQSGAPLRMWRSPQWRDGGWWFGTPRYEPFFEATIRSVEPLG